MRLIHHAAVLSIAGILLASQSIPANAQLSFFMMADRIVKNETAKAIATPGHAEWCARQEPGYRKKWNNWRTPNGRVKYCASPYFTPVWMRGRK